MDQPKDRESWNNVEVADVVATGDDVEVDGAAAMPSDAVAADTQAHDERTALARLFEHVRRQSVDGQLVAPSDWEGSDLAPEHMSEEEFEMFAYEYLEDQKALLQEACAAVQPAVVYRTATRSVGVPQMFKQKPEAVEDVPGAEASDAHDASTDSAIPVDSDLAIPEGYELVMLEGELTMVPIEEEAEEEALACDDVSVLVGKRSYYLYSSAVMTDTYAHWAFLAREDDRIVTFVDCVRSESRIYPRPMAASGLKNDPFNMTDEEIEQTWNALRESGEYPDIETTVASNGEVYYFSTEHLSPTYASSLAEWHAVERAMYL